MTTTTTTTATIATLTGSEKQIAWATNIRGAWIAAQNRYLTEATEDYPVVEKTLSRLNKLLSKQNSSKFWIETRDEINWVSNERFQEYSLFSGLFEESVAMLWSRRYP